MDPNQNSLEDSQASALFAKLQDLHAQKKWALDQLSWTAHPDITPDHKQRLGAYLTSLDQKIRNVVAQRTPAQWKGQFARAAKAHFDRKLAASGYVPLVSIAPDGSAPAGYKYPLNQKTSGQYVISPDWSRAKVINALRVQFPQIDNDEGLQRIGRAFDAITKTPGFDPDKRALTTLGSLIARSDYDQIDRLIRYQDQAQSNGFRCDFSNRGVQKYVAKKDADAEALRLGNMELDNTDYAVTNFGRMQTPSERGLAMAHQKVLNERNPLRQAVQAVNLDFVPLLPGLIKDLIPLGFQAASGFSHPVDVSKAESDALRNSKVSILLINRNPVIGGINQVSSVISALTDAYQNQSLQPLVDLGDSYLPKVPRYRPGMTLDDAIGDSVAFYDGAKTLYALGKGRQPAGPSEDPTSHDIDGSKWKAGSPSGRAPRPSNPNPNPNPTPSSGSAEAFAAAYAKAQAIKKALVSRIVQKYKRGTPGVAEVAKPSPGSEVHESGPQHISVRSREPDRGKPESPAKVFTERTLEELLPKDRPARVMTISGDRSRYGIARDPRSGFETEIHGGIRYGEHLGDAEGPVWGSSNQPKASRLDNKGAQSDLIYVLAQAPKAVLTSRYATQFLTGLMEYLPEGNRNLERFYLQLANEGLSSVGLRPVQSIAQARSLLNQKPFPVRGKWTEFLTEPRNYQFGMPYRGGLMEILNDPALRNHGTGETMGVLTFNKGKPAGTAKDLGVSPNSGYDLIHVGKYHGLTNPVHYSMLMHNAQNAWMSRQFERLAKGERLTEPEARYFWLALENGYIIDTPHESILRATTRTH